MRNFAIRIIVNAAALYITAQILPGIQVSGELGPLLLVALIFGLANAIVKPIVVVLTLPFTIVTFGLFMFIINGFMLWLTSQISGGLLTVAGFWTAVLGGIVMGLAAMVVEAVLKAVGLQEDKPRRREARDA